MRQLSLLGTPRVVYSQGVVPRFRSQRTVALLGYLAAERRPVNRERLAGLLWPDEPPSAARANLRRELHNLGRILPGCWQSDRLQVRFLPTPETTVDLEQLVTLEEQGALAEAADLLRGDFLEGVALADNAAFEIWLLGEQARWREHGLRILSAHTAALEAAGEVEAALRYGRRLVRLAPWHEAGQQDIIRLLAQTGRPLAALQQFEAYRRYLQVELDVEPPAALSALADDIRQGLERPPLGLPQPATPLIGREAELAAVGDLLSRDAYRLLTLIGLGGIGKSRLALGAAQQFEQQMGVPVAFVDLQGVETDGGLVRAVAEAAGVSFSGSLDLRTQLLTHLHHRRLLLLLDNFEQLMAQAPLLSELLAAAPGLRLLVTSREQLNLHDETVFVVSGLAINRPGPAGQSPAVAMFVEAARRAQPFYQPGEAELDDIREIGRLVGGMPLAIELAARWMPLLAPRQVKEQLGHDLSLLSATARDMPQRHVSVEAVFEHSWSLLSTAEQRLLARLSVFAGNFGFEAAAEIAGATPELLEGLRAKSLISVSEGRRLRLHELLRQYAALKLAAEPNQPRQALQRHCDYYAALLGELERLCKADVTAVGGALMRINQVYNNVLAAWRFAAEQLLLPQLSRTVYAFSLYCEFQNLYQIGRDLIGDLLARMEKKQSDAPPAIRLRLLTHYGWLCQDAGELEQGLDTLARAYDLAVELGDEARSDSTVLLFFYGWTLHFHGRSRQAAALLRKGRQIGRDVGDDFGYHLCTIALGHVTCDEGAFRATQEALNELSPDMGPFLQVLADGLQGHVYAANGHFEAAHRLVEAMIERFSEFPFLASAFLTVSYIAVLHAYHGEAREAVRLLLTQQRDPRLGGLALRRTDMLLRTFSPRLPAGDLAALRTQVQQESGQSFLASPNFGPNVETISYLTDLLAGVRVLQAR